MFYRNSSRVIPAPGRRISWKGPTFPRCRLRAETIWPEKENAAAVAAAFLFLSLAEGLAVGALVLGGICFVGTHQNAVQRAIVLTVAMVGTLLNGTLNTLVCIAVHNFLLLLLDSNLVWLSKTEQHMGKFPFSLLFDRPYGMIGTENCSLSHSLRCVMQNVEYRMIVSALPTISNHFRRKYHNSAFCILTSAFRASARQTEI